MQPLPETEAALLLRLRLAEAEVLCRECEEVIEDNANMEAQLASQCNKEASIETYCS